MKKIPTKRFVYEISIDAVLHNRETAKTIYDWDLPAGVDCTPNYHASDLIGTFLQDAYISRLLAEIDYLEKCGCSVEDMTSDQRDAYYHLKKKTKMAEAIRDSLKYIRME